MIIHRPDTDDRIKYPIALTGVGDWQDQVDAGALHLNEAVNFTLSLGSAATLPQFRLRIECRSGNDEWTIVKTMPDLRSPDISDSVW